MVLLKINLSENFQGLDLAWQANQINKLMETNIGEKTMFTMFQHVTMLQVSKKQI